MHGRKAGRMNLPGSIESNDNVKMAKPSRECAMFMPENSLEQEKGCSKTRGSLLSWLLLNIRRHGGGFHE